MLDMRVIKRIKAGDLKLLLPKWVTPTIPISIIFRRADHLSARVNAFVTFAENIMSPIVDDVQSAFNL